MIIPSNPITDDGSQATCLFDNARITAKLYTKLPSQYSQNSTGNSAGTDATDSNPAYKPWPFAVEIMQTSVGGAGVPKCYEGLNGTTGNEITNGLTAMSNTDKCECVYKNYDP